MMHGATMNIPGGSPCKIQILCLGD